MIPHLQNIMFPRNAELSSHSEANLLDRVLISPGLVKKCREYQEGIAVEFMSSYRWFQTNRCEDVRYVSLIYIN